jgi:hypothetical protein
LNHSGLKTSKKYSYFLLVDSDMSGFLKLLILALLLILIAPRAAGICKWVDQDGVAHYAETCPEDSHSKEVEIAPPPTPAQVEAAKHRMAEAISRTSARKQQEEQQNQQALLQDKADDEDANKKVIACADARWSLTILGKPLPVYYDSENKLHSNRSLHASWYEGQRIYLDDQQRQQEIERLTQVEEINCTVAEADIRERIRIYMQNNHQDACMSLRNKLKRMQAANTGIPSDQMRDLQEQIDTRCQDY